MDKLEIKRALLYNKPSILYWTVGPVETNVFPDQIDFYRICPSDWHVWESLGEATYTNFIVFGLTRMGLTPTIYHTQGEHANHYTTNVVRG
jgi:hypothetical protein